MSKTRTLFLAAALSAASLSSALAQTPAGQPGGAPAEGKPKPVATKRVAPATRKATGPSAAEAAREEQLRQEAQRLATERRSLETLRSTTVSLVRLMVEQGVITREQAMALLPEGDRASLEGVEPRAKPAPAAAAAQAESARPADDTAAATEEAAAEGGRRRKSKQVRVPYVPQVVKDEIREEIKQEVLAQAKSERWGDPNTLPEWMDRISFEGDVRIRYEGLYYSDLNGGALVYNLVEGANVPNTTQDEGRLRARARFGVNARVSDTVGAGVRLVTGNPGDPVSENATLGQTAQYLNILLDRAFIKWDPNERWSVVGGRMANPWFWPTDLVWDEDLGFDGVVGSFKPAISTTTSAFLTAGVFPIQTASPTLRTPGPSTKYLYGVQGGALWEPSSSTRLRVAAALFDFRNIEAVPNRNPSATTENDWTRPQFRQKGNSVVDVRFDQSTVPGFADYGLASKFRVLNLSAELNLAQLDPFFVTLAGDYANNIGFDQAEVLSRTGLRIPGETQAYQARLTVGSEAIRQARDWQAFGGYRHVERNAVVDAFADSDFLLGGTNARGFFLGLSYGLDRNVWTRLRWLSANQISGLPLGVDTMQADVNVRF